MAVRIIEMSLETVGGSFVSLVPTPFNVVQAALVATAESQQSEDFGGGTNVVRVDSDEDIHVDFGTNPIATTDHPKVYGGQPADFVVSKGHKVAVLSAA